MTQVCSSRTVGSCGRGSPQLEVDYVTQLPLVYCDKCLDVRIIALTTKDVTSQFYGQRFFKCPRNKKGDRSSCPNYYMQDEHEAYLRRNGLLMGQPTHGQQDHVKAGCDLLEPTSSVEKEVEAVKKELEDVKKELKKVLNKVEGVNGLGKVLVTLVLLVILVLLSK